MKKLLLPLLLATASVAATAPSALAQTCTGAAAPVVTVSGTITSNTTWTNNNVYLLTDKVYVDNGATLTIQPGTVIKGDKATKGALIIRRGSKIIADGTAQQPIVFTSNEAPGSRARGDWGGLIICGAAPQNLPGDPTIEGGVVANFGGTNAADNSGIIRYVRIEFPGVAFQPNNEINGLTLAGVGSGTIIDYVQVSYSGDDSYEWFGGTVNAKHLVAFRGLDDEFDTDNGFSGKVQYGVSLRDPNVADVSLSNGFESDNDASGSTNTPQTAAVFSNMSLFLPAPSSGSVNSNYGRGMHLRRNTAISIFNTVLTGYPTGLLLDGTLAEGNASSGSLVLKNIVFGDMGTNFAVNSTSTFNLANYFNDASRSNQLATVASLNLNANNYSLTAPSFLPQSTSPLLTGASFSDAKLGGGFFDNVAYRGAFGTTDWTQGWANFNPQTTCYDRGITTASKKASDQVQGLSVYPNPTAGASAVAFELRRPGAVTVRVFDVTGREVAVVSENQKLAAGKQEVKLPATLNNGVYTATVQTAETSAAVRFVVTK